MCEIESTTLTDSRSQHPPRRSWLSCRQRPLETYLDSAGWIFSGEKPAPTPRPGTGRRGANAKPWLSGGGHQWSSSKKGWEKSWWGPTIVQRVWSEGANLVDGATHGPAKYQSHTLATKTERRAAPKLRPYVRSACAPAALFMKCLGTRVQLCEPSLRTSATQPTTCEEG